MKLFTEKNKYEFNNNDMTKTINRKIDRYVYLSFCNFKSMKRLSPTTT